MTDDSDERHYSLTEARAILAQQECYKDGHDLDIHTDVAAEPRMVCCTRCGASWALTPSAPSVTNSEPHRIITVTAGFTDTAAEIQTWPTLYAIDPADLLAIATGLERMAEVGGTPH